MFEENRLKLGIFVITGTSLLVGFLFLLGIKDAMRPSFYVYTYFNKSVQGLEVGSPVKFNGVTVGTVSKISIHDMGKKIRVEMKTDPLAFKAHNQAITSISPEELFTTMIQNGLGCEQNFTGITGMKIIEISYFDSDLASPDPTIISPEGEFFLPAHRSALDHSLKSATDIIHQLGNINFEKIGDDLSETIAGINKLVNDGKISKIIQSVESSTENLKTLISKVSDKLDEINVKTISTNLDETLTVYKQLATTLDNEVKALNLGKLSKQTEQSLSQVTVDIKELKESLTKTLLKGNSAILDVQRMLEDLDEDPSSLILGKQKEAVFPTD